MAAGWSVSTDGGAGGVSFSTTTAGATGSAGNAGVASRFASWLVKSAAPNMATMQSAAITSLLAHTRLSRSR